MITRLRSTWLAGAGALLLILAVSGVVAGATLVADSGPTAPELAEPLPVDTTATFEDADGDGIDDDCDDVAEVNQPAADEAFAAADLDGDGTISTSEAARTGWIGGKNCNHGGYVSGVAGADADETDEETEEPDEEETDEDAAAECATATEPEAEPADEPAEPADVAPNAHGKAVSEIAGSDAVGGKNCNHGGAVSEVAKGDHGQGADQAAKAERKAERAAERAAKRAAKGQAGGH